MVTEGSSTAVSLCRNLFLFHFCYTKQFTGATCQHYSEIVTLDDIPDLVKGQKFSRFTGKSDISD